VDQAAVEEHRGDEPPPLAVGHADRLALEERRADQRAVDEELAARPVQRAPAGRDHEQVDRDVGADQDLRQERAGALDAEPAGLPSDAGRAGRDAGVLGALDPDRGEDHAVGAEAAAALGARDARLAVGVAIARQSGRRRHRRLRG
jgi:hypothetical protein